MAKKTWFEIYGSTRYETDILLAKVKSEGLARLIANTLSEHYQNVKVK